MSSLVLWCTAQVVAGVPVESYKGRSSSVEELLLQAAAVTGRVLSPLGGSKPAVHVSRGIHWGTSAAWVNPDSETCSPEWEQVALYSDDAQSGAHLDLVMFVLWWGRNGCGLCVTLSVWPLFRCSSQTADSSQVQIHEERVSEYLTVHYHLWLHQSLHQKMVLDETGKIPHAALMQSPESWVLL